MDHTRLECLPKMPMVYSIECRRERYSSVPTKEIKSCRLGQKVLLLSRKQYACGRSIQRNKRI